MENQEKKPPRSGNNEVDLGVLLNLFIQVCKKIWVFFASIINTTAKIILFILFFLKRNIIWIGLAVILGLSWGVYSDSKHGSKYEAHMTVRTNFRSSRALYNALEYLNTLISEQKRKDLARIFSITEPEAESLLYFHAEPAEDELMFADLYKEKFLIVSRNELVRLDTFWTRVEKFEDFKKKLTKFDIPLHVVTLESKSADIFSKIQQGLISIIIENEMLKKNQELSLRTQKDEENTVLSSLEGLDTLRRMYNLRIQKQAENKESTTANLNLIDKALAIKTPELDLYDKVMVLKDELKNIRNNSMDNQTIVQIYAPFNPVGKKMNLLRQNSAGYAIDSIVLVLILLIIIEVYKAVGKTENRKEPVSRS